MSNKAMRLFREAFLRTLVIVLGITIVFFAGFFIVKVATGGGNTNDQSGKPGQTLDEDELQKQLEEEDKTAEGTTGIEPSSNTGENTDASTEGGSTPAAASSKELKIAVLNSTGTKGLAGAWVEKLKGEGFTNIYAGNYKVGMLDTTKILAVADGTGSDLTSYFNGAVLETGNLTSGFNLSDSTVSTTDIDLFIIIGNNDNIVGQ